LCQILHAPRYTKASCKHHVSKNSTRRKIQCRAEGKDLTAMDGNQLQTALNNAIMSEDYSLAARLGNQLQALQGKGAMIDLDWRSFGCPDWLAERAEQMGYRFPTGVPITFFLVSLVPRYL